MVIYSSISEYSKVNNKTIRGISTFFGYFLFLLIYVYPIGRFNAFIPYFFIGFFFALLLVFNNFTIKTKGSFLLVTIYAFLLNSIMSTLVYDVSLLASLRTFLFFVVPFLAIQLGFFIFKVWPAFSFKKIAFILLCIELVICMIQVSRSDVGYMFMSLFGSEKYTSTYFMAGTVIRSIGTIGNPNDCGVLSSILLLVILNSRTKKYHNFLAILFSFIIIILTRSRSAMIIYGIVLFLSITKLFILKVNSLKRAQLIVLTAILLFLAYLLYDKYVSRDISFDSLSSRIYIWKNVIKNSYITTSDKFFGGLFGMGITHIKSLEAMDNEYLFLFMSLGIVGSTLLLKDVISLFIASFKIKNSSNRVVCLIIFIIWILNSFVSVFFTSYLFTIISFSFIGFSIAKNNYEINYNSCVSV